MNTSIASQVGELLSSSIAVKQGVLSNETLIQEVAAAAQTIASALKNGGTVYTCGNGGSACDALHFTEELVARFKRERRGYRSMFFGDTGTLTCWSNDYDYSTAFKRYAETFCTDKDVLVAISTSGNSKNVALAAEEARRRGTKVIGLLGKEGGIIKDLCDHPLVVPADMTERIQEVHITLIHIFCELLDTPSQGLMAK